VSLGFLALPFSFAAPGSPYFSFIRFLAYTGLVAVPLVAAVGALVLRRAGAVLAALLVIVALVGGASSAGAYFYWPRDLSVVAHRVPAPARSPLQRPVRIAIVSDLQAERVGRHEARALSTAASLRPDLLVLPGDFLQVWTEEDFRREWAVLTPMLADAARSASFAFAVRGNVDGSPFLGTLLREAGITLLEDETRLVDVSGTPIAVTGLSLRTSFSGDAVLLRALLPAPPEGGLHLVLGHAPDYAMAAGPLGTVDLAVAGHTHGGQVVLPAFGPLMTLSRVPRGAASGVSTWGGMPLIVSRGIGMERLSAPRIRFFCSPEVTLIEWGANPGNVYSR
jgi:predicted MPP superfamily phosphohydrolase